MLIRLSWISLILWVWWEGVGREVDVNGSGLANNDCAARNRIEGHTAVSVVVMLWWSGRDLANVRDVVNTFCDILLHHLHISVAGLPVTWNFKRCQAHNINEVLARPSLAAQLFFSKVLAESGGEEALKIVQKGANWKWKGTKRVPKVSHRVTTNASKT